MKGATGGSMGSRVVRGRPVAIELNESYCVECGAVKSQPCIKNSWENRGRGHRRQTHQSEATQRGMTLPFTPANRRAIRARTR